MVRTLSTARRRALALTVLVIGLLLAGCTDDGGLSTVGDDVPAFDDATGALQVTLQDDELRPIANGTVQLADPDGALVGPRTTSEVGLAVFSNLAPATYWVEAVAPGFNVTRKPVDVRVGDVSAVDVVLTPLPYDGPYHETIPARGMVRSVLWRIGGSCETVVQPPLGTCLGFQARDVTIRITLTPDWATIIDETHWVPNTAGFHQRAYVFATFPNVSDFSGVPDFESPGHFESSGTSPVTLHIERATLYERDFEETNHYGGESGTRFRHVNDFDDVDAAGVASVGVMIDQPMEALISIFHQEPAPEGFTALPDA